MSSDDWTQLADLTAHLEDLRHRRLFATQHDNVQLARTLDQQIAVAEALRERLLGRIRFRLIAEA